MNHMSRLETRHLFELARDKTIAGRQALAATVTDLFFAKGAVLTQRERALMTDILRQLIGDVETSVRRALSERLAHRKDAPRELVLALANDEIAVAHSILLHSEVLRDEELIEIIHHRTLEHQLAIAMRKSVSEQVCDALVETGDVGVVKTLLENTDARIASATMAYLVEQSKRVDTYQNPLLHRPDLGPDLAKKMYLWVSAALRKHILEHFAIDPCAFDDVLEATVHDLSGSALAAEKRKSVQLAEVLPEDPAVAPQLLIQSLRQGEIALFEALFAKLSGIRLTLVRRVLFERGGEGLAIACRALGIERPLFASIYLLSRKARPNDPLPPRDEIKRILDFYEETPPEAAERLLRKWRRDPDYLKAVWEIECPARDHVAG
ncbi:MAG: DUF2336 domain-containing protein [Alphaproteobacteria bacterium]|nr:DUF2336 domain-containing protein [Alphaproteobacteria bacterium]